MSNNKRLIAKIFNGQEVVMTIDGNMLSCEFGALDRGQITDVVNWGIYANSGSISFIDNIGYFNNQNVNSSKIKNHIVKFYLAKNQETLVATFKVDGVDFDDETRIVDIQLIGKIIDMQSKPSSLSQKDIFTFYVRNAKFLAGLETYDLPEKYEEDYPSYGLRSGENAELLEYIYVDCPYLSFGTFWDKTTKICQATMCRVIEDENGNAIITGERPERNPIVIRPKDIISIPNSQFVKLSNISIDATQRIKYSNKKYEPAHKNFVVEIDDIYIPRSISGYGSCELEGSYPEIDANISFEVDLPQKSRNIRTISLKREISARIYGDDKPTDYFPNIKVYANNITIHENPFPVKDSFPIFYFSDPDPSNPDYIQENITKSLDFSFYLDYCEDLEPKSITKITDENEENNEKIDSNDLIQVENYYQNGSVTKGHSEFILDEVSRRYGNGRECFEIECLFSDYYYEQGDLAFDGQDLSNHFKKYDVVIPYVMRKGEEVALRNNEDGTPKKFRIIGISYSYDGLLKQKLYLQEDRYDVD